MTIKKILAFILVSLPLMASAQTDLTPQQELEQAQKQLEAAKVALEQAKQKAAEAKTAAEAKAKTAEIKKQIEATKIEAERLKAEAKLIEEAVKQKVEQVETAKQKPTTNENGWIVPKPVAKAQPEIATAKSAKVTGVDYISPNAVPEVDGKVQWSKTFFIPSLSAEKLYNKALDYLTKITQEDNQLGYSKIVLVNPTEHSILATYYEKLVFSSNMLSYDYAKFRYALQVKCSEGKATLIMSRLTYDYQTQDKIEHYTAEEWISNKVALNKKGTRMYPISGKFRRGTINRKNQLFDGFKQALSEASINISE